MSEADAPVLLRAEFDPKVKTYWMVSGIIVCIVSIVGIVVLPFFLIFGYLLTGKYLDAMECEMTTRSLRVKKGLINTIEKSIPLDKITDLALYQGPIMRAMGIEGLRVETAGQSSGTSGSLVGLVGVKDARAFRDEVLTRRDKVTDFGGSRAESPPAPPATGETVSGDQATLAEIRDALLRMEKTLERVAERNA